MHTPIETARLANGLDIVLIRDHRAPVVTHMVWYRNGSADDPAGKSGIAHFLEHLMFKGTKKYPEGTFSRTIAGLGGQENAFTSLDYTAYFQRVPREHLRTVMDYEADRMHGLAFEEAVVAPERDVVLEERRMHVDANPDAQLDEEVMRAVFAGHPYAIPIIGWQEEIESLSRNDAFSYYQRFYAPENAILVVSGDTTLDEVLKSAEATYGKVAARGVKPRDERTALHAQAAPRRIEKRDARVQQPKFDKIWTTGSYLSQPDLAYGLDVAVSILGDGTTSRVYRALVAEQRLAVSASLGYMSSLRDAGAVYAGLVPAEGVSLERLDDALSAVIDDFIRTGPTEAELQRARTKLVADTIYGRDSQATMARTYGAALAVGDTVESVDAWPERIEAVTSEDARHAVARCFAAPAVAGVLLPA
ncbi:MAG: M16 family metallopeptidase [Bosea sp. (in: a-proteobacteria)]